MGEGGVLLLWITMFQELLKLCSRPATGVQADCVEPRKWTSPLLCRRTYDSCFLQEVDCGSIQVSLSKTTTNRFCWRCPGNL